jgi:hypothetical protein
VQEKPAAGRFELYVPDDARHWVRNGYKTRTLTGPPGPTRHPAGRVAVELAMAALRLRIRRRTFAVPGGGLLRSPVRRSGSFELLAPPKWLIEGT